MPATSPARRARRPAGETRELLVTAAIAVLSAEGPTAVTTTRLTAEVGIVQSGFYAHFGTVDDCLAEACARLVDEARGPLQLWMRELDDTAPDDLAVLERHFVRVLDLLVPRWPAIALVLRHHRDPTPLGRRLAGLSTALDADVRAYLVAIAPVALPRRLPVAVRRRLDLLAHLLVGAVMNVLETLADDPRQDRRAAARALAVVSHHVVLDAFEELFPDS